MRRGDTRLGKMALVSDNAAGRSPGGKSAPSEVSGDGARRDAPPTLAERFPGLVCDLDGVVWLGSLTAPAIGRIEL